MSEEIVSRLSAALSGRYRIERPLGEGGMATVYLAQDLRHERKVALKVLKPELAALVGGDRLPAIASSARSTLIWMCRRASPNTLNSTIRARLLIRSKRVLIARA